MFFLSGGTSLGAAPLAFVYFWFIGFIFSHLVRRALYVCAGVVQRER